ncbi:MAG TPA: TIGR00730 family Rossman fold protein [Elusimicrobiales bacterium]|nr:TIGR00730 family Rossman fold protein [Elusimicrobiales bacterium]
MKTKKINIKKRIEILKKSPSYKRAYKDSDFLTLPELRPVRLQLELLKPEIILKKNNITSTIVVFGSSRILSPEEVLKIKKKGQKVSKKLLELTRYYEIARKFTKLVALRAKNKLTVVTGGGPGIMEAANRGAFEAGVKTAGLNITLPYEQNPNPYISPELVFNFHYFAIRKLHFVMRSKALVVFPGGFGTMDELFETLTLVQTGKKSHIPIILVDKKWWTTIVNFEAFADFGTINRKDLKLMKFADNEKEIWQIISDFYKTGRKKVKK